jgi:hypothetical protein
MQWQLHMRPNAEALGSYGTALIARHTRLSTGPCGAVRCCRLKTSDSCARSSGAVLHQRPIRVKHDALPLPHSGSRCLGLRLCGSGSRCLARAGARSGAGHGSPAAAPQQRQLRAQLGGDDAGGGAPRRVAREARAEQGAQLRRAAGGGRQVGARAELAAQDLRLAQARVRRLRMACQLNLDKQWYM